MIIYNVTTNIHESVHDQWLKWMQEKHIPEILATQKFSSARIVKVLVNEEMGGITYSVCAEALRADGHRVVNDAMIHHPARGGQKLFRAELIEALIDAGRFKRLRKNASLEKKAALSG